MGRRRNRNKFPEDVFGHLNVVVGNEQSFLNVLVGVALTHEALNLTGELRRGCSGNRVSSGTCTLLIATCFSFRVDSPREWFGGPLRNLGTFVEVCGITIQRQPAKGGASIGDVRQGPAGQYSWHRWLRHVIPIILIFWFLRASTGMDCSQIPFPKGAVFRHR